jgi:hypothetical protein
MNWQHFSKSARTPRRPDSYRPHLDRLEDRVVPAPVIFRIRWNFSPITVDATLNVGTGDIPITEQSPGSLTAQYAGRQQGDLDLGGLTLTLNGTGTQLVARNMGNYAPAENGAAGTAPANYGGKFQLLGDNDVALRNIISSVDSGGPMTLTPLGGGLYSFPSEQLTFNITNGFLDYATGFFGSGRTNFTGSAQNTATGGTVRDNGDGSYKIDIPVDTVIFSCFNEPDCTQYANSHVTGTLGGNHLPAPLPGPGHDVDPPSVRSLTADVSKPVTPMTDTVTTVARPARTADGSGITGDTAPATSTPTVRAIARLADSVDHLFVDPIDVGSVL